SRSCLDLHSFPTRRSSDLVHYLVRPDDPTKRWSPVQLHHEPTVHRMRWVKAENNRYHLVVLPLHGRGNKNGEGAGVKVIAYEMRSEEHTSELQSRENLVCR